MSISKQFLIINRKAPYGRSYGRDAIDVALVAATFNQPTSLLYMDDGVYQLLKNQAPDLINQKNSSKILPMLEMYDINNIYVECESLAMRNLAECDLAIVVKMISSKEVGELIEQHQVLLGF